MADSPPVSQDQALPTAGDELYCANKLARAFLQAVSEVMMPPGYTALLKWVELERFAQTPPPDDWQRTFHFRQIARIDAALLEMYGPVGGHHLAQRIGRAYFQQFRQQFGILPDLGGLGLRPFSPQRRIKIGLSTVARLFTRFSDQVSLVEESDHNLLYQIYTCPVCYKRRADQPTCDLMTGFLQEATRWLCGDLYYGVQEVSCLASGGDCCSFRIERLDGS